MSLTDELNDFKKTDTGRPSYIASKNIVEEKADSLTVEAKTPDAADATADGGRQYLIDNGYSPDDWVQTGMRRSSWTMANGSIGESVRYTFTRNRAVESVPIDDLMEAIERHEVVHAVDVTDGGFVVALGDMQVGKMENPTDGVVQRFQKDIDKAHDKWVRVGSPVAVHIAFLGDHIEGFNSQHGNNAWRTPVPLTEQIMVVRRLMLYAVQTFADAPRLTVTAVPGNHGEAVRFGKSVTTYDDSFDTDALSAVKEACELAPDKFGNVTFILPKRDELTTIADVANTRILHFHGHQARAGRQFEWWQGQAFNSENVAAYSSDVLLGGHWHHLVVQEKGDRTFIQVPSLEEQSTWFRHRTGEGGNPGIVTFETKNGRVWDMEVMR